MDPITRRIMAALFGYGKAARRPYHAKVARVTNGLAQLSNGVKLVASPDMKPGTQVVVIPTDVNPIGVASHREQNHT